MPLDLEQAVRFSLQTEVPSQVNFTETEFDALYSWVSALAKYLPLHPKVLRFLEAVRLGLADIEKAKGGAGGPLMLTGEGFTNLIRGIKSRDGDPFADVPQGWVGCKGSQTRFRGYPCSLWQTFHTLTVAAHLDDRLDRSGNVARTIAGYVSNFFLCTDCAAHFATEVGNEGPLPTRTDETILWLWRIHNKANMRLRGKF